VKVEASVAKDWEAVALALDVELHLRHRQGDVPGIRTVLNEMETVVGAGSNEAACLSNAGLGLGILFRDSDDGVARGERAVAIARRHALTHLLLRAQCRLIAVLHYWARLYVPSSRKLIVEARAAAEQSGDRFLRSTIEANIAVFQLDVGDLDQAEESLARAGQLLLGADLQHVRTNHQVNRGELALLRGEYAVAESLYRGVRETLNSDSAPHVANTVYAGLGLCAVEQGRLSEARRIEELLERPSHWYFEPSLILRFRATLFARRGMHQEAIDVLREPQPQLFPRMVNAWLKIRIIELELAVRIGGNIPEERIEEARLIAHRLRLHTRATWLDRLRERIN
jgi:tetratricopeptide (TPR) repeat protein